MARSPQEIKTILREAGGLGQDGLEPHEPLPAKVEDDLKADERDPSRVAPSAEGVVTFPGLSPDVRSWLAAEIEKVGRNGNGHGPSSWPVEGTPPPNQP